MREFIKVMALSSVLCIGLCIYNGDEINVDFSIGDYFSNLGDRYIAWSDNYLDDYYSKERNCYNDFGEMHDDCREYYANKNKSVPGRKTRMKYEIDTVTNEKLKNAAYAANLNEYRLSNQRIQKLMKVESFSPTKYWDYSQWSIGYGTNIESLKKAGIDISRPINQDEAYKGMMWHIEAYVNPQMDALYKNNVKLTQNMVDAMVMYIYNTGSISSNMKQYLKDDNYYLAMRCMNITTANGKVLKILEERREDEKKLFMEI